MSRNTNLDELAEELADKPVRDLVAQILRQYQLTGTVRQADLHRLLGSQSENDALRQAILQAVKNISRKKSKTPADPLA